MKNKLYYKYWGKAGSDDGQGNSYHLLPYHCLDVAAVADCWWQSSSSLRSQFTRFMQLEDERQAKAWVLFFIALHDLGKLDIRFQMKAQQVAIHLQPDIPKNVNKVKTEYAHGEAGYAWFWHELDSHGINSLEKRWLAKWMVQVAGHHGIIPSDNQAVQQVSGVSSVLKTRDQQARIAWISDLQQLFSVDLNDVPEHVPSMLAGFCSVCDWIGSSEYFGYETTSDIKLEAYFDSRSAKAEQVLQDFGILPQLKANNTLETLFPLHAPDGSLYKPRGLQTLTTRLPWKQNLSLIEAPTGSGKTETALVYAANLLQQGLADSIIFALPTQATANAMLERLEDMAKNLFFDGATVVLAHGKSKLKESLEKILDTDKQTAQGEEEAGQQSLRWLTASKKRAFLGQIGVCTIDQVLLSVLPVKHKFVRSFGIHKSVLIVDEVHAYDSYMYGLLEEVLKRQYLAGGSALLLSATLPQYQRSALARSWETDIEVTTTYPLLTQIYANQTSKAFQILEASQLPEPRTVQIETWALPDLHFNDDSLDKILDAAGQGAKVAVICNLVADAQDMAQRLNELASQKGLVHIEVDLFHSRYRYLDRHKIEKAVKNLYGKDKERRAVGGRILVATQVIEQSLDLDFDWLVTQLCPADLLFQRLGRLHRHKRDDSERPINFRGQPCCAVIVPEQEGGYGNSQYVYENTRTLWRTRQLLSQNSFVSFPKAYRDWIDKVYKTAAWPEEPEAITSAYQKYQDEVEEVAKIAAQWVKNLKVEAVSDECDKATTLTRDGEMSLTLLPVLKQHGKTYTLENELLDKDSKVYWELVSLNSVCVPNSWNKNERLFAGCDKEDEVIYLSMQKSPDGDWFIELNQTQLRYSVELGLVRMKKQ